MQAKKVFSAIIGKVRLWISCPGQTWPDRRELVGKFDILKLRQNWQKDEFLKGIKSEKITLKDNFLCQLYINWRFYNTFIKLIHRKKASKVTFFL